MNFLKDYLRNRDIQTACNVFFSLHALEIHTGAETSVNSASSTYGVEEGKGAFSPGVAFQATTHRRKAQTREAINCSQRKKGRVERIGMKKDLRAGRLVQIKKLTNKWKITP